MGMMRRGIVFADGARLLQKHLKRMSSHAQRETDIPSDACFERCSSSWQVCCPLEQARLTLLGSNHLSDLFLELLCNVAPRSGLIGLRMGVGAEDDSAYLGQSQAEESWLFVPSMNFERDL